MIIQNNLSLTDKIAPADQAAVAGAVRAAFENKTAVYPIGGGTATDYGVRPTTPGIELSLGNLNRLIDYRPDDLTVTVEAGMTMAELCKILAKRRQRLPIDVALPDPATVGGLAAINSSGPRRLAYGTMRDYVLGFTAVDGQGAIFSGGGRVLKNAAGYNTGRLIAGSLGTLGIITQLTLRVNPLPEMSALAACDLPNLQTAEKLIAELMQSLVRPAAIELALGKNRQNNPVLDAMPEGAAARLFVGFEGDAVEVQSSLDAVRENWQTAGIASPVTATKASATKSLWNWLVNFPAQVQIAVRPGAITKIIGALLALDSDCDIRAHAGSGILKAIFSLKDQDSFALFLRRELRPLIEATDGKLIVVKNPPDGDLNCRDIWGPKPDGFAVMQSLKDRFDPAGILNPGRFLFDK